MKTRWAGAVGQLRDEVANARWTDPLGWHLTLKFLGATAPALLDRVTDAIRAVASRAHGFRTRVTGLGAFPAPTRARVLWAGLADEERRFPALAGALAEALQPEFPPENRPFTPHLTLARLDPPRDLRPLLARASPGPAAPPFAVDRLVLYRSHLSSRGARYERLAAAELATTPDGP